jgi:hypothetical protein
LLQRHAQVVEGLGVCGEAGRQIAVDLDRALEVSLLQEGAAQVVASGRVVRVPRQEAFERRDRGLRLALLHQGEAEAVRGLRARRIEGGGLAEGRHGSVHVAQLLQGEAELELRRGKVGAVPDHPAEAVDGGAQVAFLLGDERQVVARLVVVRQAAPRLRGRASAVQVLVHQRVAPRWYCIEETRVQAHRLLSGDGGRRSPQTAEDCLAVRASPGRVETDRASQDWRAAARSPCLSCKKPRP